MGTPLPQKGGTAPPVLAHVLWPNGCMDQGATWYGGRPRPRSHCDTWGPRLPLKEAQQPPNFRTVSVVAKRLDGSRCHLAGDIVLDGDPVPPPKWAKLPIFGPYMYVCCGQAAGWIKMPLETEVGLGRPHCVRWGLRTHPRPRKEHSAH